MKIAFLLLALFFFMPNVHAKLNVKTDYTPYGPLFYPNDGQVTYPGIIVFHGSEGGGRAFHQLEAQLLAMQGYAALAYCYFQCLHSISDISDPQMEFIDISIDKPYEAFKWLKESKYTKNKKTGILGTSKGAELTFLIASISAQEGLPVPDAIAAHAVTDAPEVGFSWNWMSPKCWIGTELSSAKWNPVCGQPPPTTEESFKTSSGNGCYATPIAPNQQYTYHSWTWKGSHELIRTHHQINLEKYDGPIFFTHGIEDALWCFSKAQAMNDRLIRFGKSPEVHFFKEQGHSFKGEAELKRLELLISFFDKNLK